MINLVRDYRTPALRGISPAGIHKVCRACYIFWMVVAVFLVVFGPATLLVTNIKEIGGDTIMWDPTVRYYGKIVGGVTWVLGTILLFFCHQYCSITENNLIVLVTRYRRQRQQAKSPDIDDQVPPGGMGDAVQMEDIPLNVTVSDIPLVGVTTSDHSIASHHMTIESWFNKKFNGRQLKINKNEAVPQVHVKNVCSNNNMAEENPANFVELQEIQTDFQKPNEIESCAGRGSVGNNLESCTKPDVDDPVSQQYFSRKKVPPAAQCKETDSDDWQEDEESYSAEALRLQGLNLVRRHYAHKGPSSSGDDEEEEKDDLTLDAILKAITSIEQFSQELSRWEYIPDVTSPRIDYDESFEADEENKEEEKEKGDDADEVGKPVEKHQEQTADSADNVLETNNKDLEHFAETVEKHQELFLDSEACVLEVKNEDVGYFVDPFQEGSGPVEAYPVDEEQITCNKARSSQKSIHPADLTISREFNPLQIQSAQEEAAGDTHWHERKDSSPGEVVDVEDRFVSDTAALGDFHKDQNEEAGAMGESTKNDLMSPREAIVNPDAFFASCDGLLGFNYGRRSIRDEPATCSSPNVVSLSSPDCVDKDSSSSSGFSEGACVSEGSILANPGVGTVRVLSEPHVKVPEPFYPSTVSLESPERTPRQQQSTLRQQQHNNTSSCNSNNSPEANFPLQMKSANIDLLAAVASVNNNSSNNTNCNNINRNNNIPPLVSRSEGNLETSSHPSQASAVPVVRSYSSNSFQSTTTEGTMYTAQESIDTPVVDSDDSDDDDYYYGERLTPEIDSAVVDIADNIALTDLNKQ